MLPLSSPYLAKCGLTRQVRLKSPASTSCATWRAPGRLNAERHMRTTDSPKPSGASRVIGVILLAAAGLLVGTPSALADGNCGPIGGGGTRGCPPTPNPTPLTVTFSMPGRNDAVAVTETLTRGLQQ